MNRNYKFDEINEALPVLMSALDHHGDKNGSRNGDVKELMHLSITLMRPERRETLIGARRANLAALIAETMWVLAGRNDVEWLERYLPRAGDFSDDGQVWRAGYGPRLRYWYGVDQLAEVINILAADPLSRRAVMSIFDPQQDYLPSKDIPCNNWLSFSIRDETLDLHVAIRSNDAMWGWSGINCFEWSVLLEVMAGLLGVDIGSIHYSITSFHLYEQHWDRAETLSKSEVKFGSTPSPRFGLNGESSLLPLRGLARFDHLVEDWFRLEEQIRTGTVVSSEIEHFPEPMLRSFLQVIQWWWTGEISALPMEGSRLYNAALAGVQPPVRGLKEPTPAQVSGNRDSDFIRYVCALHNEKHAAYGDSWMRRGEMLGIMANIARKIDRLGKNGGGDTATDTAVDLFVYLAKYRWWLYDHDGTGGAPISFAWPERGSSLYCERPEPANALMKDIDRATQSTTSAETDVLERALTSLFDQLEGRIIEGDRPRIVELVGDMLIWSNRLARTLWEASPS